MEKIDQVEILKNVQTKIAKDFGLQWILDPVQFSDDELEKRCKHQLFDGLKQHISSHLSSIDALFNASVVLQEHELSTQIASFLDDINYQLSSFVKEIASFDEDNEKGGEDAIS